MKDTPMLLRRGEKRPLTNTYYDLWIVVLHDNSKWEAPKGMINNDEIVICWGGIVKQISCKDYFILCELQETMLPYKNAINAILGDKLI